MSALQLVILWLRGSKLITRRSVGYKGYTPTDDILVQDTTVYSSSLASWVTKITGYAIEDVFHKSEFRFKASIRAVAPGDAWQFQVLINGIQIWYEQQIGTAWHDKVSDIEVSWKKGDLIEVQIHNSTAGAAGTIELKDFSINGQISPVRLN